MHTAPGAYLLHAPGAVCILNMILEHILLIIFFQILVQDQLILDHKSRPNSLKKCLFSGVKGDYTLLLSNFVVDITFKRIH